MGKRNNKCRYDLNTFPWGVGWTSNNGKMFIFDKEDFEKIKDYTWVEHIVMKTYHRLETRSKKYDENTGKWKQHNIPMHYVVVGEMYQDHINQDPLDNRKCNLRKASQEDNRKNHKLRTDNTSGITGISLLRGHYYSRIYVDETEIGIYYGDSFEEAAKTRLIYEMIYYPDGFETQRHLFDEHGITKEYVEEYKKTHYIRKPEDVKPKVEDITGKQFNNFIVQGKSPYKNKEGKLLWDCVCICQLTKPKEEWEHRYLTTNQVKRGTPKSCGCLKYTKHPENIPKRNTVINQTN